MSKLELIELSVELHHETNAAWLISDDGERKNAVWIPKSKGEIEQTGKVWTLTIPEWLAMEKGLI